MSLKKRIWLWLGALTCVILGLDLAVSHRKLNAELHAETIYDGRVIYGFMMATRRVYQQQFIDSGLPVNSKTIGFLPAHSLSRIAKDFHNWNDSGVTFNNVSDRPRNPDNLADTHELAAMAWFRANPEAKERLDEIVSKDNRRYLQYSAPIWIEPMCLRCHGRAEDAPPGIRQSYDTAFDYKVGELRGLASIRIPAEKHEKRFREIWFGQLVKSLAGYLILFIVIGLLIERLVTRRLARMQDVAERIADGDYSARVERSGSNDEVCRLADTFNKMTEAVQERGSEIDRLAYHNPLTGMPNRALLMDRLGLALSVAHRRKHLDALIMLNLDRFKNLNDAHGHSMGNLLLVELGERLAGLLREGDTLAHLTGDEFAILLQDLGSYRESASRHALTVAEKIHNGLRKAFHLTDNEEVVLTASIGITLSPEDNDDSPEEVLRRADTALHRAKEAGGNQTAFFESDMGIAARQRYTTERELRRGIAANEMRLFLQPQVYTDGRLAGAEALVRWQHPERGLLPPGAFIGIAEESDLIIDLGAWVLSEACHLMARETVAGFPLRLSVNISPRQFRQRGFVPWIRDLLSATGADPTQLTLEVTEGMVIDDIDSVIAKMNELAALGIHFSIDDFGTGYSSLAYLKRMPIHELKIDKSFVQDAPLDPNDAALVETILSVARHLHLQVVAEGVETAEQANFLNELARVIHQGYLYGKPESAEAWVARWRKGQ